MKPDTYYLELTFCSRVVYEVQARDKDDAYQVFERGEGKCISKTAPYLREIWATKHEREPWVDEMIAKGWL